MEAKIIAARLQDINEGLLRQLGGITETYFRKTKRLGAAVRICNLIKGRDVIDQYDQLCAATGELGIGADTAEKALNELEEIGYVTITRTGGEIAKIEERIPLLDSQYTQIGEKWAAGQPSELEQLTLEVVDDLLVSPRRERDLISAHNVDEVSFRLISDVGKTGAFLQTYKSPTDGSEIAYSPLYHDENPEQLLSVFDKFPDEDVSAKLRSIRHYQGSPIDLIKDPVILHAVKTGCLPTPSVHSSGGLKHFAFTPLEGVGKMEKGLLEKARAIIACVRYGQHFATITRVSDPLAILRALRQRKRIGSHSEILKQYALLHKMGVGVISRDRTASSRFAFTLLDTPENLRALDMAIQYLTIAEPARADKKLEAAKQLLLPGISGSYGSPAKTRYEAVNLQATTVSEASIGKLNHLLIGGSSGF
jgi:hypothetical protein